MIATLLFVLAFVLLGLTVVFLAMRSGPRQKAGRPGTPSRGNRRVVAIGVTLAALAFGIGVPAAVIAANSGSQSRQATGGVELTAFQQKGRRLYAGNCSTCHTLASANSVGRVGPNLDTIRPPKALVVNAIKLGRARGMGQMPVGLLDGRDAEAVSEFVAVTAGR